MLKKQLFLILVLLCFFNLNAQDYNKLTLRIEPGILLLSASENLGFFLNVEPKIKISENYAIGLRFGAAVNSQKFEINDSSGFNIDEEYDNAVISFVPTFDYYLNENNYRPYVGLGLGYYILSTIDISRNGSANVLDGSVNNQLGFLLRVGFESSKTRIGLEYNFIPKANIEIPDGQIAGAVNNSYFGVSIGFTIGGGKY